MENLSQNLNDRYSFTGRRSTNTELIIKYNSIFKGQRKFKNIADFNVYDDYITFDIIAKPNEKHYYTTVRISLNVINQYTLVRNYKLNDTFKEIEKGVSKCLQKIK